MYRSASSPYIRSLVTNHRQLSWEAHRNNSQDQQVITTQALGAAIRETGAGGKERLDGLWSLTGYCVSPNSSHYSSENRKGWDGRWENSIGILCWYCQKTGSLPIGPISFRSSIEFASLMYPTVQCWFSWET